MAGRPDLQTYQLLHRGMRDGMARVQTAVAGLAERDTDRAGALDRWFTGFLGEFRHHHSVEDEMFFPALAVDHPPFAEQIARLDDEHRRLDVALDATEVSLRALADPNATWPAAYEDLVGAVREACTELNAHLDYEDAEVLPLFVEHMTVAEFDDLTKRAGKSVPMSQARFTVPWMLSQTNAAERKHLLGDAPSIFRLLWYATRHRYAKLDRAAFGP
jgi:hypothetical protein